MNLRTLRRKTAASCTMTRALPASTTSEPESFSLRQWATAAYYSGDLMPPQSAPTLFNGAEVMITKDAYGRLFINDAVVVMKDVPASNGVIHIIDAVILPPAP